MAEYKEGVDFEWVDAKDSKGNVVKDGKGKPVKTRRFFKKSEKEAMKNKPKAEEKPAAKPAGKPAKKDDKKATNAVRPAPGGPGKLPAAKKPAPGGARPEGKPSGMPAAKPKKDSAGMPILGVGAAVAAGRKPAQGRAYNPNFPGGRGMAEGFQGRYATEVGRPRAAGGARIAGGSAARGLRGPGGAQNAMVRARDPLMLNFNKGGMVAGKQVSSGKSAKTYKK